MEPPKTSLKTVRLPDLVQPQPFRHQQTRHDWSMCLSWTSPALRQAVDLCVRCCDYSIGSTAPSQQRKHRSYEQLTTKFAPYVQLHTALSRCSLRIHFALYLQVTLYFECLQKSFYSANSPCLKQMRTKQ